MPNLVDNGTRHRQPEMGVLYEANISSIFLDHFPRSPVRNSLRIYYGSGKVCEIKGGGSLANRTNHIHWAAPSLAESGFEGPTIRNQPRVRVKECSELDRVLKRLDHFKSKQHEPLNGDAQRIMRRQSVLIR